MFNKKKNKEENVSLAKNRIFFAKMTDDDVFAKELVDKLREGAPLVINFEDINESATNKFLAFLSGATVAFEGRIIYVKTNIYLFARKEELLDGSLKQFLNDYNNR